MTEKKEYICKPEIWVDQFSEEFFRFAMYRVKNKEVAEDLVQDTFLSGLKALPSFRRDCSEKSWLYNILRNKIVDYFRKKANHEIKHSNVSSEMDEEAFFSHFFHKNEHWKNSSSPISKDNLADKIMEREEFMQFLMQCLSLLPDKWSKVFSLKNIEEYSTKEVCKELEITPSNLWTIIHRSKLQLRGCLEKHWKDK